MVQSLYLTQYSSDNLCSYQIQRIESQIIDYININKQANEFNISVCPKCGKIHPVLIKGGKANSGKQMLQCKTCKKRFVVDHGQLTFYSHQSQSKWNDFIIDTKNGVSLKETSSKINVHESTAFRMRHKLLHSMEKMVFPICVIR